jgi:hypothetical protein
MNDRSDLIVQCFRYLIDEYGFKVERKEFDPNTMGNAVVIFKSTKIGIEIVIDRDQALISIGDQSDPRKLWFEFGDVVQFFAPFIDNVYDFPEETPETGNWDEIVEAQLNRLAAILRQYCEPLLTGEPLMKTEIKKVEEKRVAEMFKRYGQ